MKKNIGVETARQILSKQHPIRCAIFGHFTSAVLVEGPRIECLRCGGRWDLGNDRRHQSLYEWFILWPLSPIRRRLSEWQHRRWERKHNLRFI